VTITATGVTQDEPVNSTGDGNTCPDAVIVDGVASVRRERAGNRNGRVYTISFIAESGTRRCEGSVPVCVPHDQGGPIPCVDDGQAYVSTIACPDEGNSRVDPGENPTFRTVTWSGNAITVQYSISIGGHVSLGVFDVAGRRRATLVNEAQDAGAHAVSWNTRGLSSGLYFYRLRVNGQSASRTLLIAR
jgi:hypothetical protein